MAAPHSVDPAQLLEQHLADASPDLLREMIASFANAMMSAQADQLCGAGYGERSAERTNRRNGTGRGSGTPGPAPSSWRSRGCARARSSRTVRMIRESGPVASDPFPDRPHVSSARSVDGIRPTLARDRTGVVTS
jgi:hypothetical protein